VTVVHIHFSSTVGGAAIMDVELPFSERQEEPGINGRLKERSRQRMRSTT